MNLFPKEDVMTTMMALTAISVVLSSLLFMRRIW